eukprot:125080_1
MESSNKTNKRHRSKKRDPNKKHNPRSKSLTKPKWNRRQVSSSEFDLDRLLRTSSIYNKSVINQQNNGLYEMLKNINEIELKSILWNKKNPILFDSFLKVYSDEEHSFIDVAALLTSECLYFTNARKYQVWTEFRDRSQIDNILEDDTKIDENAAKKLISNMDITDDAFIISNKIIPFLLNKTINYIKLNVLMNPSKHISLPSIFGISDNEKTSKIKNTNCVIIENIDAIDSDHMDDFMRNVFDDIAWIDEEIRYNSKIVKLNKYHTKSILHSLNKKKDIYFLRNKILNQETVIISQFDNNKIRHINNFKCKVIDLHTFDEAKPISMKDKTYCFKLQSWSEEMNKGLTCSLQSNNRRHEWITHLDYLYENVNKNKKKKKLKTVTFKEQTQKMSTVKRLSAV